jgi:hypothetical protein
MVEQFLIAGLCASGIKVLNRSGNPAWSAHP